MVVIMLENALRANARAILTALACTLLISFAANASAGDGATEPEEVYLTAAQALRAVLPEDEAPVLEKCELALTTEEKARIEARLGGRLFEDRFIVHRGRSAAGALAGYAVVTEEIGKFCPITFIVGIRPDASVRDVAVMVYRESRGGEVQRRRFLAQFVGKGLADPIRQNKDILNVTGATLSVRSVARGVRKVLYAVDELAICERRRAEIAWTGEALEPSAPGAAKSATQPDTPEDARSPDRRRSAAPIRRAGYLMGTILQATAYSPDDASEPAGRARTERAIRSAFEEVARLERLWSPWIESSELVRVNREASLHPVTVSAETIECVALALEVARRSGGAFDPTLRAEGWRRVALDLEAHTIAFLSTLGAGAPPLTLDLGGIGKGFALDRAAEVMRAEGVTHAMLDFGGQLLAVGPPADAPAWLVAVPDPRAPEGGAAALIAISSGSVSSSDQIERAGHIRDPKTGRTACASLASTVRAPTGALADALSTATFVLGPERGAALAAEMGASGSWIFPSERAR